MLEFLTQLTWLLLGDCTSRHEDRGQKPEKKCHEFHARIIEIQSAMATLIPPKELLSLYASGWFPMAGPDGEIRCYSPDPRGILPLEGFKVPHGTRAALRDPAWEVRIDTAFEEVVCACAKREETWIDDTIFNSYLALHTAGYAHSLEVWRDGKLAGGLYGVELGAAFFGESMFHRVRHASKVALAALVARMKEKGFELLDIQWITPHLAGFGAIEVSREEYLIRLESSLQKHAQLV